MSFAASATDTWSQTDIAWDFGDGNSGSGTSVTHAYDTPGSYTVTAKATDASGHSASKTGVIAIASPSAILPPALVCGKASKQVMVNGAAKCVPIKRTPRCKKGFRQVRVKVRQHGKIVRGKDGKPKTKIVCKKIKKHRKKRR